MGIFTDYDKICDEFYKEIKRVETGNIKDEEEGQVLYIVKRDKDSI